MADEKNTSKRASKPAQKNEPKRYYIVNPGGAVHEVTREHARERIRSAGWRMASDAEIKAYQDQAIQRADQPIATPFVESVEDQAGAELE